MRKSHKTFRAAAPQRRQGKRGGLGALAGKTIAVIGFGSQGEAQCLNMRDSGLKAIVGLRKGSQSWKKAKAAGCEVFETAEAARRGDIVHVLAPDEMHAEIYELDIKGNLWPGKTLSFSHGFSITFGLIKPPKNVDVILVSPKAPGKALRENYLECKRAAAGEACSMGQGVPGVFAVHQDCTGNARETAIALAKAIGIGGRENGTVAGGGLDVDECTFEQETHVNLFAEQAVLCGGLSELIKAGFETLVKAGYPAKLAYVEVVRQTKLLADLIHEGGIEHMWSEVSNTAEYGGRTRGPRVIGTASRMEMEKILAEIRSGKFAREWMEEYRKGLSGLSKMRADGKGLKIQAAGTPNRQVSAGKSWPSGKRNNTPIQVLDSV